MQHEPRTSPRRARSTKENEKHDHATSNMTKGLRKLETLKIEPDIELHRSSSGRNIRLKHSKTPAIASPHGLTPRAPERRSAPGFSSRKLVPVHATDEDEGWVRAKTPPAVAAVTAAAKAQPLEAPSPSSNQLGSATKPQRVNGKREDRRSSFMIHAQVWEQLGLPRSTTPDPQLIGAATNQEEPTHVEELEEKPVVPLSQIQEEDHPEQTTPEAKIYQFDLWKRAGRCRQLNDAISGYDSAPSPPRPSPPKTLSTKRRSSSADHMGEDPSMHLYESAQALAARHCFRRQHHSVDVTRETYEYGQNRLDLSLTRSTSPVIGGSSRRSDSSVALQLAADSDDRPIGRWRRGDELGRGTFGSVYKGLNTETGEFFALKEIEIRAAANDDQMRQLFKLSEEIEVMHNLRHDNIVRYKGSHRSENRFYIFMEFVPGGSIASNLSTFGAFDEDVVRNYTRQIVDGVVYLHEKGILHRDIKGANVLVTDQGVAKLADFGCSKRLPQIITTSLEESLRSIRGSIPWMAPEVVRQTGHSLKADIWSIGATVIEMATAKHPWPEMTNGLVGMYKIATTKSSPPIPEGLSQEATSFLARCFCIDPNERATAVELSRHSFLRQR